MATFRTFAGLRAVYPAGSTEAHFLSYAEARASGNIFVIQNSTTMLLLDFEGALQVGDGSESKPSHGFISDPNSGLYLAAADTPALAAGGTKVLEATAGSVDLPEGLKVGGGAEISEILSGSATWDPGTVTAGNKASTNVTVPGALATDVFIVSHSNMTSSPAHEGYILQAFRSGVDTVRVVLMNISASDTTLGSGTVRVVALRFA